MKMVKSLFLGTAAGLVAMTGAQAADLPVKAKPVQYVKICSLYGAGFYYIPGTDMCLKIGGFVRAEYNYNGNGSSTTSQIGDFNIRSTNNTWWRQRGYITADARNQTEYGTVRGYIAVGLSTNDTGNSTYNAANQFDANRAMVQFAGFTFGRTQSFYDFYSSAAHGYNGLTPNSDTGDGGQNVLAYTAQFGNGLSGSISLETRRMTQLVNANFANNVAGTSGGVLGGGTSFTATGNTSTAFGAYAGNNVPDIIGNLRVDQAWGSAQVMGVLHEVNSGYYNNQTAPVGGAIIENSGHPSDKWGFAVGAGVKINAPMIGQGDYLDTQVNYTQGALRYVFQNPGSGNWWIQHGQQAAYGLMSDGVFGGTAGTANASSIELTTAWNVNAHYEHFWNKAWQTSAYGGYAAVSYNATANNMVCNAQAGAFAATTTSANIGSTAAVVPGCNNNWSTWWVGSRTQWNLDSQTSVGVDVLYLSMSGASAPSGTGTYTQVQAPISTGTNAITSSTQSNWAGRLRVHRNFYP